MAASESSPVRVEPSGEAAARSERAQVARAAGVLMLGVVLSRVLGLAREQVTSYFWGTTDAVAAFTIADNVHTMLFDLVISGMLQAALVPVLSAYATPERREEFRRIVGALLVWVVLVVGATVVVVAVAAPWVVLALTALGGGEAARGPETFRLTIRLVRLIVPAVLLLAFSTVLMGALYALQRFTQPSLALSVRNAAIVACALAFGHTLGVASLVVGVLLGAFGLAVLQLWGLRDCLPKPNLQLWHPAIRRIFALYLPIFLGLFANTVALTIDRNLAWGVDPHALGAMRYATALNQMILGLVAAATSLAALPTLSRHAALGDEPAYQRTLALGLKFVSLLIFPATFGMAALGWPIVTLLFYHGATDLEGARAIWIALLGYLPGTLFAAFDQVLIFAAYARQNTRTPVLVGVLSVGVYFLVALALVRPLGMLGLVLGNTAQFIGHALVMWWVLRRWLGRVGDGTVGRTLRACALAALVMALVVGGFALLVGSWRPPETSGLLWRIVLVAGGVGIGAVSYALLMQLLRVDEFTALTRLLRARLTG
ncbi:murein biosynthesis integral membrane protein MurJ [Thermomicrobium sp. 4228-Ro]|uniref:murein biosynthesis integral membrane protein MurJ n=1 Tax=Thermomicrobium sp. 4228-Ro TaxID=2993937 RepID=UPI002248B13A|nr:murein biosynthesis integral membrane protein MurJ [Thermomicrobium sp. 4228-Ro]MCX2726880.1 murein biosynthesis integral membrane protein MurJ [Thermomicrobium sp. 4228-Ro]